MDLFSKLMMLTFLKAGMRSPHTFEVGMDVVCVSEKWCLCGHCTFDGMPKKDELYIVKVV